MHLQERNEDLMIFGYSGRLIIELEDGPHDISRLLRVLPDAKGWALDAGVVAREIDIERRSRARAKEQAA